MQTEIDRRFQAIEDRIKKLENKDIECPECSGKGCIRCDPRKLPDEEPIIKGLKKSAMLKEAVASVDLDKGVTQTSESVKPLKTKNKNTGRTGNA